MIQPPFDTCIRSLMLRPFQFSYIAETECDVIFSIFYLILAAANNCWPVRGESIAKLFKQLESLTFLLLMW